MTDADLPVGYRWAAEHEMDRDDAIVVSRTVDSQGVAYTHGEADIAVPIRKARPNKNYILSIMRDMDMGDPWGAAMSMAFAVAECLEVVSAEVPEELGFQPSPFVRVSTPDEYREILESGQESYEHSLVWEYLGWETGLTLSRVEEVQFAGRCLHRYIDWCKAAGKDY